MPRHQCHLIGFNTYWTFENGWSVSLMYVNLPGGDVQTTLLPMPSRIIHDEEALSKLYTIALNNGTVRKVFCDYDVVRELADIAARPLETFTGDASSMLQQLREKRK